MQESTFDTRARAWFKRLVEFVSRQIPACYQIPKCYAPQKGEVRKMTLIDKRFVEARN
jgi:hypothetical protein